MESLSKGLESVIVILATPPSSTIESLSNVNETLGGSLSIIEKAIESFANFPGPDLILVVLI